MQTLLHISFLLRPLEESGTAFEAEEVKQLSFQKRSSWLNCALRDDEAVYWVSLGHYEAVAVGN